MFGTEPGNQLQSQYHVLAVLQRQMPKTVSPGFFVKAVKNQKPKSRFLMRPDFGFSKYIFAVYDQVEIMRNQIHHVGLISKN